MTDRHDGPEATGPDGAGPDAAASSPSPGGEPSLREAFGFAVRNAGIGQVAPGEMPTAASLLKAVGGVRGIVEAILPALGFLLIYAATENLAAAVLVPVAIALGFVVVRLVSRSSVNQAFAGVAGVAISAGLALFTGKPEDNFVPGLIINAVSLLVLVVSILARHPLIGLIVGVLSNDGLEWRNNPAKMRVLTLATVLWCGLFLLRLVAELPLYFAGEVELLGTVKIVLGVPLYAVMLWVTWMLVRSVYRRENAAA